MDFLVLNESGPASWQRFFAGRSDARSTELSRFWERVLELGVDPNGSKRVESIITDTQLDCRRREFEQLLAAGTEILESTAAAFSDRNFLLLLADRDGVVLRTFGGGEFAAHARRVRLIEGAEWGEGVRGTNAIGTALIEERPVVVGGYAHFERVNHNLICCSAPIRNPAGEVVAVLDATSYARTLDPLVKAAIVSAARAVEETWRNAVLQGLGHGPERLARRLENREEPSFGVAPGGAIIEYNQAAAPLLKGRPPNVQQTLGVQWSQIEQTIEAGDGVLTLTPSAGVRQDITQMVIEPIFDGDSLVGVVSVVQHDQRHAPARGVSAPDGASQAFEDIFGDDPALANSRNVAARFAASSLPILLLAETGTGKDLMARAIHQASDRADEPFVAVNCGALTPALLESELFGYGPGAFTGASPEGRIGRIGAADGGTLFLDEVGEMPANLQTLLLRVLEDGSYNRVGELETRRCDIRLICATCRDLPAMVEAGEFRKDLYYRIRGAFVTLPPLREREGVVELAEFLLEQRCETLGVDVPRLGTGAVRWLRAYQWPGNVRELKNAMYHALVLSNYADELEREHFPDPESPHPADGATETSVDSMKEAERSALVNARKASDGNITEMARRLGVARTTVYRMLERHGLN